LTDFEKSHSQLLVDCAELEACWMCPPFDWVKLNCDGVVNHGALNVGWWIDLRHKRGF